MKSNPWPGGGPGKPAVLVVDDDPSLQQTMRMLLQSSFDVTTAGSVDEALDAIVQSRPEAVIMDLTMPNKDGIQGLKEICPAHPDLPVMILTGYADDLTVSEAIDLGAYALMRKPFDLVELVTTVTEMTQLRDTSAVA